MRRLTAGQHRHGGHGCHTRDERGVTLILVALTVMVIMAMGALVIDVGAMLHERRELQNGADAAALAIAHACAAGEAACDDPMGSATSLAGANAVDGASAVDSVTVDVLNRRVTVRTSTSDGSGGSLLPFNFGKVVTGQSGTTLHATATATWGAPASARTLPLTLSQCEFDAVAFGATTVIFHNSTSTKSNKGGTATTCPAGPGGKDIPGGFGWIDQVEGANCQADLSAGNRVSVNTGVSAPNTCDLSVLLGQTLLVPIYDDVSGSGTTATYRITGFGAFRFTGYRFPGKSGGSPVPCKPSESCIGGVFTEFVTDAGSIGGSDLGVTVIKLIG